MFDIFHSTVHILTISFFLFLPFLSFFFAFSILKIFSATEGADSHPASGAGTPTDEKAGQVGMGKFIVKSNFSVVEF